MDLITLFKSHMTVLGNLPTNEPRMTPQMDGFVVKGNQKMTV